MLLFLPSLFIEVVRFVPTRRCRKASGAGGVQIWNDGIVRATACAIVLGGGVGESDVCSYGLVYPEEGAGRSRTERRILRLRVDSTEDKERVSKTVSCCRKEPMTLSPLNVRRLR